MRATAAGSYYEQTFYSQRAGYNFVYTPKYGELDSCLRFSDGTQLSRTLITSAKYGSTVSVVAEDTTYYYFAYWEDLSDSNNRKVSENPVYTYTVTGETKLRAIYYEKLQVTYRDEIPAENRDSAYSYVYNNYEYLKPGEKATDPYGGPYGKESIPYVRTGWRNYDGTLYDFNQPVTENLLLRMGYKEGTNKYRLYTACSPAAGGKIYRSFGSESAFYAFNEIEMLYAEPESGYRFAYFIDNSPAQTQYINDTIRYAVKGNYTVKAVFKKDEPTPAAYDIVVQHGSATAEDGATRKYESIPGKKIKIQADQGMRANLVFDYWEVVSDNVKLENEYSVATSFTMPAGHVAIRAVYKEINTVYFDSHGGYGYMEEQYVQRGQQLTLPECTFKAPEGKVFGGWDAGQPGDTIEVTDIMTVKALWKTPVKSVSLYVNKPVDGDTIGSRNKVYGYPDSIRIQRLPT